MPTVIADYRSPEDAQDAVTRLEALGLDGCQIDLSVTAHDAAVDQDERLFSAIRPPVIPVVTAALAVGAILGLAGLAASSGPGAIIGGAVAGVAVGAILAVIWSVFIRTPASRAGLDAVQADDDNVLPVVRVRIDEDDHDHAVAALRADDHAVIAIRTVEGPTRLC